MAVFRAVSFRPLAEIVALKASVSEGRNPRDIKFELAMEIVARFHDAAAATQARDNFIARFSQKSLPTAEDLPLQKLSSQDPSGTRLGAALREAGLAASNSEANRKIQEGAVKVDGSKVLDRDARLAPGPEYLLQLGSRRFARVQVLPPV